MVMPAAPPVSMLMAVAPEVLMVGTVTEVKLGVAVMVMLLQVPPVPKVMVLPVLVKLPEPAGQIKVVLPCTAVLATEP